ncbi:GSCOCG00011390001-RA-CDS [Cotesia congregata]|nr:GSCOCG00011390001-RA-CDS [Cotesia congregata]
MSYSIFLIHYEIQTIKRAFSRVPTYFNDAQMMHQFFGELVIYILGGFVFSLVFESPFLVLEKLILANKSTINQSETVVKGNKSKKLKKIEITIENGVADNGFNGKFE